MQNRYRLCDFILHLVNRELLCEQWYRIVDIGAMLKYNIKELIEKVGEFYQGFRITGGSGFEKLCFGSSFTEG